MYTCSEKLNKKINGVITEPINSNIKQLEEWCKEQGYHTRKGKNIIEIRNNKKSKITIRFLNEIRNMGVIELSTLYIHLEQFLEG